MVNDTDIDKLKTLANENDFLSVFKLSSQLFLTEPSDERVMRHLAFSARKVGLTDVAIDVGLKLVDLHPNSEYYSVSLFHAFAEDGDPEQAFGEIQRLFLLGDSPEYRRILSEMREEHSGRLLDDFEQEVMRHLAGTEQFIESLGSPENREKLKHLVLDLPEESYFDG